MELKYKDLTADNLFDFCLVLDAIGVESALGAFDAKEITTLQKAGKNTKGVGTVIAVKIAGIIIKNLPKAKNEIYTFFSNALEWDNGTCVTAEEIGKMKLGQLFKMIREFFTQDDLTDFFKEVAEFLDSAQSDSQNSQPTDTEILALS